MCGQRVPDAPPAAWMKAAPGDEFFYDSGVFDERQDDPLCAVVEQRAHEARLELWNPNDRRDSGQTSKLDGLRCRLPVRKRVLEIDPDVVEPGIRVHERHAGMEHRSLCAENVATRAERVERRVRANGHR